MLKKLGALILAGCFLISGGINAGAVEKEKIKEAADHTASLVLEKALANQDNFSGREWEVMALARSSYQVPGSYYDKYCQAVEKKAKGQKIVLYTEYSRMILALTAIGKDAAYMREVNLLEPLGDFDKTIAQGVNGAAFALLALDAGGYEIPVNTSAKTQATREMYLDEILSRQLKDGGFALSGGKADPDVTGMVLQALAKHRDYKGVEAAIDKALALLSSVQDENGGYKSQEAANCESSIQVIMALCELGIDPEDSRFVKNGVSLVDNLLSYYRKGKGFAHTLDGAEADDITTQQAFYCLVNMQRVTAGKTSLYRMEDAERKTTGDSQSLPSGLEGKNGNAKALPVMKPGRSFADIKGHVNQKAIEELAARGIINGVSENSYAPDKAMTRAEFATIVVRALGLDLGSEEANPFQDVAVDNPYAAYIETAYSYGIVKGTSQDGFSPSHIITRQEAAVMVANAAKLCGLNTAMTEGEVRDMLAQFSDYTKSADWAKSSLAFCYREGIVSQEDIDIQPHKTVSRGDIAGMLYHLLMVSDLL